MVAASSLQWCMGGSPFPCTVSLPPPSSSWRPVQARGVGDRREIKQEHSRCLLLSSHNRSTVLSNSSPWQRNWSCSFRTRQVWGSGNRGAYMRSGFCLSSLGAKSESSNWPKSLMAILLPQAKTEFPLSLQEGKNRG